MVRVLVRQRKVNQMRTYVVGMYARFHRALSRTHLPHTIITAGDLSAAYLSHAITLLATAICARVLLLRRYFTTSSE